MVTGAIALVAVAVLSAAQLTAVHARDSARRFLADIQVGNIGQPASTTVLDLVRQYSDAEANHSKKIGKVGGGCDRGNCEAAFLFDNEWLRRLKFAPPVWMRATISIQNGMLTTRNVEMGCGAGAFFLASTSERLDQLHDHEQYHVGQRGSDGNWRESVTLGPGATPEQRRAAFGFNVDCLSRWGGCKDAAMLLPTIPWPNQSHLQPAYSDLGYGKGSMPQAEQAAREVLSPPIFPEMTDEQQTVAAVLQAAAPAARR